MSSDSEPKLTRAAAKRQLLNSIPTSVSVPPFLSLEELQQIVDRQAATGDSWSQVIKEVALGPKYLSGAYFETPLYDQIYKPKDKK